MELRALVLEELLVAGVVVLRQVRLAQKQRAKQQVRGPVLAAQ